LESSIS